MPKYYYRCNWCDEEWQEWRPMSADRTECICARRVTDFEKIPQPFTTTGAQPPLSKPKVGEETKRGIEENREILKQMKEDSLTNEFIADD